MIEGSKSIDASLEPLDEYVVIQPVSDETETRAGLILPASAASASSDLSTSDDGVELGLRFVISVSDHLVSLSVVLTCTYSGNAPC